MGINKELTPKKIVEELNKYNNFTRMKLKKIVLYL